MDRTLPRVASASVAGPTALLVTWKGGGKDQIELAGWVATGGATLAPLKDSAVFASPRVINYGAAVGWGDDEDLAIDALHLKQLASEQKTFGAAELAEWQAALGLSNQEAASFLNIGLSTWNGYKAGAAIPTAIGMLCRATLRDPILMQAHYRPRKTGRPRKEAVA